MIYEAVVAARKAAEVHHEKVREAVRMGLELKRELDLKKQGQKKLAAERLGAFDLPVPLPVEYDR